MRYLVTGGAGFIGSTICHRLVADGHEVVVLDNFSTGDRARLEAIRTRITLVEGDIRDRRAVDEAVRGADIVFHEAALPSVARSVEDPLTSNDVNVTGTLTVLEAARRAGVGRLVYAASSSAYGDTPTLPKREDMKPSPRSPYAIGKLTGEYYVENYTRLYGLPSVSLRYFNVFGPRQDPKSHYAAVIPRFVTAALKGEPATVYGDGLQSRDFTFVENVVDANLLAAQAPGAPGRVFNIACGERYTLLDLLAMIAKALGRDAPVPPIHELERQGDVRHSLADITAARETLGFAPRVGVPEGLRRTVEWYRERR
jgi:nucleoside-diphosphate-sugar epimerase